MSTTPGPQHPVEVGPDPPAGAVAAAVGMAPHRVGRILVADDNALNQRLAALILAPAGYQVDTVGDGADAVEAVARLQYDAVLMDCEMPRLDGYAAAAEIRRQETARRRIPIIAVSASSLAADARRALAAGMDAHVSKPFDVGELYGVLNRFLGPGGPDGQEPTAPGPGGPSGASRHR